MKKKIKQYEAVIKALEKLKGIGTLGQLYVETFKIPNCSWGTKTPYASIRRIVQTRPEIYKIKKGLYGLVKYRRENDGKGYLRESKTNRNSKQQAELNHTYYQGLLLEIGNLKKFDTYCPNQDKNRIFIDKKLDELRSMKEIPTFSYPNFVRKCRTVDVVWFNSRKMPNSLFEVEHSTDFTNSFVKLNELLDFRTEIYIVSDSTRKREYSAKISSEAFKDLKSEVSFLSYDSLIKQYEWLQIRASIETNII